MSDHEEIASPIKAGERFRSGRVIGRMFSAMTANALFILPMAILLVAAPSSAMAYLTLLQQDGQIGGLLQNLVVGLFAIFVQGVTIKACLDRFAGKRVRVGRSLGAGGGKYFGMFGVRWLTNLGTLFGLILLIVPGLIWATSWVVAGPALIGDDTGSQGPLARSAQLTKGHRWPIFGLMLLFLLVYVVLAGLSGIVFYLCWRWIAPLTPWLKDSEQGAGILATPIVLALYEVFAAAGSASIYWELKLVREGGGADVVSRVFA